MEIKKEKVRITTQDIGNIVCLGTDFDNLIFDNRWVVVNKEMVNEMKVNLYAN